MIQLGQKVRDVVTGFEGIAIARTTWLNGCERITIAPKAKKGEALRANATFDEEQLQVLDEDPIALPGHVTQRRQTGGDRPDVTRRAEIRR